MSSTSEPDHPHPAAGRRTAAWTPDRIHALGTLTDVATAAAIFELSRSVAYDLVRTGGFPVPVLRFGTRYRIPAAAILTALHLAPGPGDGLTNHAVHASIVHTKSPGHGTQAGPERGGTIHGR